METSVRCAHIKSSVRSCYCGDGVVGTHSLTRLYLCIQFFERTFQRTADSNNNEQYVTHNDRAKINSDHMCVQFAKISEKEESANE